MTLPNQKISVVTPTYIRPTETISLLDNLSRQELLPFEVIIVDGSSEDDVRTEKAVHNAAHNLSFKIRYVRHNGGTAIQRNKGIELATGEFIALIDDDVRLDENFFTTIVGVFNSTEAGNVGGIVGYRKNRHFELEKSTRWQFYKRLKLLTTFEPGRYDFNCGYPINNNMQPPFAGTRPVDYMTTACAVWRREVFDDGLRFHPFFRDYGVLEDAHFSLTAGRKWDLLQCGDALCEELSSPNGRVNRRQIGYKCVVNYYFVFQDIVRPLSFSQKMRFWRYQAFEFIRIGSSAVRRRRLKDLHEIIGRIEGVFAVIGGAARLKN